jgi:hypothetical protein
MIGGGQTGFPFSPPNILSSVKEITSFNSEMTLCKSMKRDFSGWKARHYKNMTTGMLLGNRKLFAKAPKML